MRILSGPAPKPRRILLYGQHGVGKSTFASQAPGAIFLNVEDGLGDIDCHRTDKLNSYADVISTISWLAGNDHPYKTVVVDTLDWLEGFIFQAVAAEKSKSEIEDIGYGKGYKFAAKKWHFLLKGFEYLRDAKGMTTIFLAHAKIEKFDNPEGERYDRYEPDLNEIGSSIVQEWCDEVLFASFRVTIVTEDNGFNRTRGRAIGGKERFIRTNESAAAIAKNRLRLPDELEFSWAHLAQYLPQPRPVAQPAAAAPAPAPVAAVAPPPEPAGLGVDIGGLVVDGSSKVAAA